MGGPYTYFFFGEENTENGSSDLIVLHFNPKIS